MELFKVAVKNVFRNARRTVLNVIALTVGISIMVICIGWVRGYFTVLFDGIIDFDTGHIQILHPGYQEESRRLPLDYTVTHYEELREKISGIEGVRAVTGRIMSTVELSNGRSSVRMYAKGIDPRHEDDVTVLDTNLSQGEWLTPGEGGILLGKPLAEKLELEPGDTVYLKAWDRYSVENFIDSTVVGVFNLAYPAIDENVIFMDLYTASGLLSLDDEVTHMVVKLEGRQAVEDRLEYLQTVFLPGLPEGRYVSVPDEDETADRDSSPAYSGHPAAYPWQEFAQTLVSAVKSDFGGFIMMIVVIYILILLGILNSMSMSIHERIREVGTLRAIGMRRPKVVRMFLAESTVIALIGAFIGLLIAAMFALYLTRVGIDFSAYVPENMPIPFGEHFTADYRWYDFVTGAFLGVVTAIMGGYPPSRRAARTPITDAMGSSH
ncbi:MAG: ABC transporter permease [Sediminispirochaetaceae bacterium]